MDTVFKTASRKKLGRWGLGAVAGLALLGASARSFADSPYAMAPPIDAPYTTAADSAGTVFGWQDVPVSERVPIRRAVFDQGGYQLYDTVGETIVIPFTNQNLYAMKFGVSDNGTTYFVNDGDAPVLYIPRNGYLENAAAPGSRWYPFPKEFHESTPVFIGLAPSWDEFCGMGWYPDMVYYGGYWGRDPFIAGRIFAPTFGLTFVIGGHHYDGWEPYHHYYDYHPAPYRVTVVNRTVYNIYNDRERNFNGQRDYSAFRGTGHSYDAHRTDPGSRDFRSIRPTAPVADRTFNGGSRNSGGSYNSGGNRTFNGGQRTSGARPSDANRPVFGGARPDAGTRSDAGTRPTFDSGGRSGGTQDRTFHGGGGGGRPAFDSSPSRPSFDSSTPRPSAPDRSARPSFSGGGRNTDRASGDSGSHPQSRSDARPEFNGDDQNGGGRGGR